MVSEDRDIVAFEYAAPDYGGTRVDEKGTPTWPRARSLVGLEHRGLLRIQRGRLGKSNGPTPHGPVYNGTRRHDIGAEDDSESDFGAALLDI